ncbi:MAG: sigma-70 family RNA polymerase sigma factor [candidate division Zixibacteria bacterium]|nr:sigma-70 family RNA polymerase sigma factor [candidate division Zixibacteria bacterium]
MSDLHQGNITNLIDKCKMGDEQAWFQLVDLIAPVIFSICKQNRLSRDEGFDIYGQVCYELVNNINKLKSPSKILYFVATMTRRKIYSLYRKMRVKDYIDIDISELIPDEKSPNPEKNLESLRRREWLFEAMMKLPEKEYQLLHLLFFDKNEPSYKDIAKKMKIPVSSIGPTRGKALNSLKRIIKWKKIK